MTVRKGTDWDTAWLARATGRVVEVGGFRGQW